MATIAVSHTGFQAKEVVPFGKRTDSFGASRRILASDNQDVPTHSEVDIAAKLLCALSAHTSLREAMLSYHSELPEAEASEWTEQVLRRMDALLPSSTASELGRTYDYSAPWVTSLAIEAEETPNLLARLALPAVVAIGAAMFVMCIVGFVTTYHHLFAR